VRRFLPWHCSSGTEHFTATTLAELQQDQAEIIERQRNMDDEIRSLHSKLGELREEIISTDTHVKALEDGEKEWQMQLAQGDDLVARLGTPV
jgi:septal ring factor EnvC (AmiA/AmiB activator)